MAKNKVKYNWNVDVPVLHMCRLPFYGRVVNWSIICAKFKLLCRALTDTWVTT